MTEIILCGCMGHMGKVISSIVSGREDCRIVAGVDIAGDSSEFPVYRNIADVKEKADVVIDFSHVSLLDSILDYAQKSKTAAVLCTTGYTSEQVKSIEKASKDTALFYSRNMSLGINLLIELAKKATALLGEQFDIEIVEKHHNQKIDAPSGTALMIADAVSAVKDGDTEYVYDRHSQRKKRDTSEIGIHSVRGGTIVGEHEVIFAGRQETLTITHSAQSKELFAVGAVNAAVFMKDKQPGLYDMSAMI